MTRPFVLYALFLCAALAYANHNRFLIVDYPRVFAALLDDDGGYYNGGYRSYGGGGGFHK